MKAIVGVAGRSGETLRHRLTATFVKGNRRPPPPKASNSGSAITDASSDDMRVPGYGMLDWTAYWQVAKTCAQWRGL